MVMRVGGREYDEVFGLGCVNVEIPQRWLERLSGLTKAWLISSR